MDQVGYAYQTFAKRLKHDPRKKSLGLPRRIHGPGARPMPGQDAEAHCPPEWLELPLLEDERPQNARHASPVHLHIGRGEEGLIVRVAVFPARYLPDREGVPPCWGSFCNCSAGRSRCGMRGPG